MKGADIILLKAFAAGLAAPFVAGAAVSGLAGATSEIIAAKFGAAAADFNSQAVDKKVNMEQINFTSVLASFIFK